MSGTQTKPVAPNNWANSQGVLLFLFASSKAPSALPWPLAAQPRSCRFSGRPADGRVILFWGGGPVGCHFIGKPKGSSPFFGGTYFETTPPPRFGLLQTKPRTFASCQSGKLAGCVPRSMHVAHKHTMRERKANPTGESVFMP